MALAIGVSSKGTTSSGTSQATGSVTTQASGSLLITGELFQSTAIFSTVADSKSNTYTQLGSEQSFATATGKARLYYKENAVGGASHTATFTNTGAANPITDFFAEFTGALTVGALDGTVQQVNDSSSPFTLAITPSAGNRVLVALFGGDSASNPATNAESSGFTVIANANETNGASFWTGCLAYKIVVGDGSTAFTASFTETGGSSCAIILASFKEAPSNSMGAQRGSGPGYGPLKRILAKPTRSFTSSAANLSLSIDTAGSITLAGQSTTLSFGLAISTQGAITIAGQPIIPALTIPLGNGAITIAGQSTTFAIGLAQSVQGAIILAGQSMTPALTVPLSNGAITLAGQSIAFNEGLAVSNGLITLAGQTLTLDLAGNLSLSIGVPGQIIFNGQVVTLDLTGTVTTIQQPAGSSRKQRRRYEVEIDGQVFPVESIDQARALLERARELATKQAASVAESVVRTRLTSKAPERKPIRVPVPQISTPDAALANIVIATRHSIARIYREQAMVAEIRMRMQQMEREQDEEDVLLLL